MGEIQRKSREEGVNALGHTMHFQNAPSVAEAKKRTSIKTAGIGLKPKEGRSFPKALRFFLKGEKVNSLEREGKGKPRQAQQATRARLSG